MILVEVGAIYDEAQTISDRYCSAPTWRGLKLMLLFRPPLRIKMHLDFEFMFNLEVYFCVIEFTNVVLD